MISATDYFGHTPHVYAPCPFQSKWINQHLLKDCGLVPYMLHKVFGYNATMAGVRHGEYPYLELLPGMKMEFYADCANEEALLQAQISYARQNYRSMDIIILNGPYWVYQFWIPLYKQLRPDGKVYLGLDANSDWMDWIDWRDELFSDLLNHCDVIATSCRKMQSHLNAKWPRWQIEYIPNGFFNPTGQPVIADAAQKQDIILTVGRIGSEQKSNHILLEAFALISEELPSWELRLVGGIEPSFNGFISDYFARYPALKNRVTFTGLVENKAQLYDEYRRAKVFALTSTVEGGAPNVVAEALMHGCYPITSDIDASLDITANGALGRITPIGDTDALAAQFLDVCNNQNTLQNSVSQIHAYATQVFDWELIIKRLNYLLFYREGERHG